MTIDVVFLLVFLYGFYKGFGEGIIKAIFSVLSVVLGLMFAFKFSPAATKFLEVGFKAYNPLMFGAGFLLSFFGSMWLMRVFAGIITETLEIAHVNLINQMIGGVVMSGLATIVLSMMIWFADAAQLMDPTTKAESVSYRVLEKVPGETLEFLKTMQPVFSEFMQEANRMMDGMKAQNIKKAQNDSQIYNLPPDDGSK